jgi:hypothetical protein
VTALPALANIGFGALGFGQAVSPRPFSWVMMALGMVQWLALIALAVTIAGRDE